MNQKKYAHHVGKLTALGLPYSQGKLSIHADHPDDVYYLLALAVHDKPDGPTRQVVIEDDGPCGCETFKLWR